MRVATAVKRMIIAAGAFAVTLALTGGSPPRRKRLVRTTAEQALTRQLEADVREAVRRNQAAPTRLEWDGGGFTPTDIFRNSRALHQEAALCTALSRLGAEDLALFENALVSREAVSTRRKRLENRPLSCAPRLLERIADYWEAERRTFDAEVPENAGLVTRETGISAALPDGQLALIFADGPHATRTARLAALLRQAGVRATFFQLGEAATRFPDASRLVLAGGHALGSHGSTHADLVRLPLADAEREIEHGHAQLRTAVGRDISPFFLFPYESRTPELEELVAEQGLSFPAEPADSRDWQLRDPARLWEAVRARLDDRRGGALLFHDGYEQTLIVLPRLLTEMAARGIEAAVFVPEAK